MKRRLAVGGGVGEHFRLLEAELVVFGEIALRELGDYLPGRIDQPRRRRHVVGLIDINEVLVVW